MRILHCLRAPVGGLFRHVLDLAARQAELGHAVGMIADSQATDALTQQRLSAIAPKLVLGLHRVAMSRAPGLSDVNAHSAITALTRPLNLDILHGHGAKGGLYANRKSDHVPFGCGATRRCRNHPLPRPKSLVLKAAGRVGASAARRSVGNRLSTTCSGVRTQGARVKMLSIL